MTKISTPTSTSTTSTLESTSTTRPRRTRPSPPWHPPPSSPKATSIHPLFVLLLLSLLPTQSTAFAAWFVDRRVSCFTDLLPGEIIMNNAVTNSDESRRWGIHVGVSPGDAAGKEYRVEFVVPSAAISTATATIREDVQYILELSGGSSPDGPNEPLLDPPAKFVESPDNGGVGCEGRRSYGKIGVSSNRGVNQDAVGRGAVVRFHEESAEGARLEIWGGWATGHEAVKLTDKVVVVYGKGIVDGSGVLTEESEGNPEAGQDDWEYADDEAEYQHEAELLTENQELLEKEFDQAEQDAIQALEEKRIETDGRAGDAVNDAEEEIVQSLEENRRDVEKAVEALRQAIQRDQFEKAKMGLNMDHAKKEYSEMHKRFVKEKVSPVDQLIALQHHFQKQQREARKNAQQLNPTKNDPNNHNPDDHHQKEEKLEDLLTLEDKLQNTFQKLKTYDTAEHDKAQSQHQQPIPKEELEVDLYELKRKAKERLKHLHQKVSDTFDRAAVGVNEMFTEEQRKEILRKAEEWRATIEGDTGTIRGRGALSDGVQGRPLPPEGRHFLFVFFGMFGMVGLVRWMLEKRRRKVVKSKRSM